jgi:replicative superfamily II helicase
MSSIPSDISPTDAAHVETLLEHKPFDEINDTQRSFLQSGGLEQENTLLVAETGNGKTLCAEMRAKKALSNGKTIAYLVPSKQLTNGKYDSLTEWIDTDQFDVRNATWGGVSGYTTADVIVATFESYFEAVVRGVAHHLDLLIFDDFHELYSEFRGPTIEKGITAALHRGAEVFAMSATIGNPAEIAQWMDASLITSPEDRGVPITESPVENDECDYGEIISDIIQQNEDKGPFIVFNYRKDHTESRARNIAQACSFEEPEVDYREELESRLDTTLTKRHEKLLNLMENGVAFHHADLDQASKELVEEAVKSGDIRCVPATTTLAYGFDAPIQSVIVADLKRKDGFNRVFVGRWEYIQWVGRAGRDEARFDEAYAFPIYGDEDADEYFEFGTPVEEKSLEAIASHVGVVSGERAQEDLELSDPAEAKRNFRWLVLELICGGWQHEDELLDFLSNTLYWQQLTTGNQTATVDSRAGQELQKKLRETVSWLRSQGFVDVHNATTFSSTEKGDACFEFQHSTWVESSLSDLNSLLTWIERQETILPEQLIGKIADTYWDCDLDVESESEEFGQLLDHVGLEFEESARQTAGIICWYWCEGIPIDVIEGGLDADLSHLPTIVERKIAPTVDAIEHLFKPTEQTPPEWIETLIKQLSEGVTRPDLYLTGIQGVARGRITNLDEYTNSGMAEIDTDVSLSAPLIVKLATRWDNYDDRSSFRSTLLADQIGQSTAEKIIDALDEWVKDGPREVRVKVPFEWSAREFLNDWSDERETTEFSRDSDDTDGESSNDETETTTTTLNDYL